MAQYRAPKSGLAREAQAKVSPVSQKMGHARFYVDQVFRVTECFVLLHIRRTLAGDVGAVRWSAQWLRTCLQGRCVVAFVDNLRPGDVIRTADTVLARVVTWCTVDRGTVPLFYSIDSTFDCLEAKKCLEWIETLTGLDLQIEFHEDKKLMMTFFYNLLKDGTILCRFIDTLMPHDRKLDFSVKAFQPTNTAAFASARSRERIGLFLDKVREYGISCTSSFQTDYLYERTNLVQVCTCIRAIGIEAQTRSDYHGPYVWPKKAKENKREFTQEQLQASKQTISLQYGTNVGASQAGISFGKQRMIID